MLTFKRRTFVLFGALLLLITGVVLGQSPKIGFVNSQEVLYGTDEGRKGLQELEEFGASKQTEFEAKNKELMDLQQEFQAKQRTLNPDALAEMQSTIEQGQLELRRFQEDAQAAFNQRQTALLQAMSGKVQQIIQGYAQSNSYSVIFMRDQTQAYVNPSLDVSKEIIRIYNEQYPSAAPTAAPAAPPSQ
jgi:Skp family chaperone for outer membrane proteins